MTIYNQTIIKHFEHHLQKAKSEKTKYHIQLNMMECDAIPKHWEYVQQEAIKTHAADFIRWNSQGKEIKTAECAAIVFYTMIDVISIEDTDANWGTFLQYTPLAKNKLKINA